MAGSQVSKSYGKRADPVIHYCTNLTVLQSPAEKELQERTLTMHKHAGMLGAPEVLHLGKTYIHLIGAKRCLDIGTSPARRHSLGLAPSPTMGRFSPSTSTIVH